MRFQILQAGCGMCTLPLAMLLFLLRDTESSPRKHEHITCAPPSEDEQTGAAAMGNIIHPDLLTKGILKNLPPGVGWENDRQAVAAAAAEAALCFLRESLHVHLTGMDSSGAEEDMFSSRVMFRSEAPRSPPRLQQSNDCTGNVNHGRAKRYARRRMHGAQRQLPVCDSDSGWTNKSVAIDIKGNVVEVLKNIRTNTGLLSQYFYETWCRSSLAPQWGCRGVDKRYWRSQCKTTQSFVRALTKENGRHVQWRFIRINTACVCALQSIKLRS